MVNPPMVLNKVLRNESGHNTGNLVKWKTSQNHRSYIRFALHKMQLAIGLIPIVLWTSISHAWPFNRVLCIFLPAADLHLILTSFPRSFIAPPRRRIRRRSSPKWSQYFNLRRVKVKDRRKEGGRHNYFPSPGATSSLNEKCRVPLAVMVR